MEIEEKYERARRATQFAKWSDNADTLTGLPVLNNKRKGWHIPISTLKKPKQDFERSDTEKSQESKQALSKTELRRLKEIKKKDAAKLKRNKQSNKVKEDNSFNSEIKILIKRPKDVARICDLVMSDPEKNIELLAVLLEYCEKNWNSNTKKIQGSNLDNGTVNFPVELCIISLVIVVKDLVPGYRISNQIIGLEGSGSETTNDKVSLRKETQQIHSFERRILNIYKRTCLLLKKILRFGGKNSTTITRNKSAILRSTMDLLDATYHFNHHTILLRMIILFLMSGNDEDLQTRSSLSYCSEGLTNVLTNDTSLETGVEAVNMIHEILFDRKSKKSALSLFTLSKWVLFPFTKYAPWHRIEESKSEFRRIFGPNTSTISKEIIDEIQKTSTTRVKVELLIEREEQILKHLFTFYSKVLLLDFDELEHVYLGISQYSNRISLKIRSELIGIIKGKLYNSDALKWQSFVMVLKCCFSLLQRGNQLNEQQLEDNSWILRYLVLRLEKEHVKIKNIFSSPKSTDSSYIREMGISFQDKELPTVILNTSIFSSSNSSYLYRLMFVIAEISLVLCESGEVDSSIFLIKLCGQLIIKFPKLRVLLDPEGIPCNDFPIDANCILSTWKYQEVSLYYIFNEIIENNSNSTLKLACNMLLSESADNTVRKNAVISIKKYFGRKEIFLDDDAKSPKSSIEELKPLYYILKLVNM
ncbi:Noc3 like involved in nuclear export of pre-ribosomes [Cryptosporidium sp. chipmunk genotype I]|uniref:Noc3 like involved in nuclear export of pre-ribosomes n=1 Tax=Cryptosporidium sp. chipmunk genotype I TaxID=1280935 RepID=UPI00351A0757|nr:Noc3 like involved in nuclear export of pre-ribosomes [Cryptosporidium sp. chipmunk genotype I]